MEIPALLTAKSEVYPVEHLSLIVVECSPEESDSFSSGNAHTQSLILTLGIIPPHEPCNTLQSE